MPAPSRDQAVLIYRCPTTQHQVQSEIETTPQALQRLGAMKLSLWCPHCKTPHTVCASETAAWTKGF